MIVRDIAHCRAGDKGDTLNVSVIAYDERDYAFLAREVTVERVRAAFGPLVKGRITRYELPNLGALNFVLEGTLSGGVTTSLAADAHGKTLSALLVAMELPAGS